MKVCFATNNKNKLAELHTALGNKVDVVSIGEIGLEGEIPETGDTLEANSLQKAAYIAQKCNVPTIADDTGLEVEELQGRPGVYSARYAGPACSSEDNMDKLLLELKGKSNRKAAFKTVITFFNNGEYHQFLGECVGTIREERSGKEGFGYDPIFEPEGFDITFAEMDMAQKNEISHRGRAVKKLAIFFNQLNK